MPLPIPESIPRCALVTGGAKRLGRAMALALAEAGFDLAIHFATSAGEAEATAQQVRARGRRAVTLRADLMREDEVARLLPEAAAALGPLGVLVNNASTFGRDEWHDATRASWERHIEPNLRAPFVLAQAFAHALPKAREGVVVNMLDQRVWSLTPHFVSYTVSKAGLWALTRSLALALAPRIRVNAIAPAVTLGWGPTSRGVFDRAHKLNALGRGVEVEHLVGALLYLLRTPTVTGQTLTLDSGQRFLALPRDVAYMVGS